MGPGQQGGADRNCAPRCASGLSPTALKVLKQSFNTDTEQFAAVGQMAYSSLKLFGDTPEALEGITAFNEKRAPDFAAYRGN